MSCPVNTTVFKLYNNTTALSKLTDGSLSLNREMIDTTSKDSAGNREVCPGLFSASISFSGLHADADTMGFSALQAALVADAALTVKWSSEVSGEKYYSASGHISSLELNSGGFEENVTYSGTIEITGAVTEGTVV